MFKRALKEYLLSHFYSVEEFTLAKNSSANINRSNNDGGFLLQSSSSLFFLSFSLSFFFFSFAVM
jgi:hypothetical protein